MIKTLRVKGLWAALLALLFSIALPVVLSSQTVSAATTFAWKDAETIIDNDTPKITYTKKDGVYVGMTRVGTGGGGQTMSCPLVIKVGNDKSKGTLYSFEMITDPSGVNRCNENTTKNGQPITISNTQAAGRNPDGGDGNGDGAENDCPIDQAEFGRWATCGLWFIGKSAASTMDGIIQNFLFTPVDQIFNKEMKTAWNSFSKLGVGLILIVGLVMVVSQALGMEIFDAYTVRKVLPRLLIAAIGIALSWSILRFVVVFFNDLGLWAHDLIIAPFGDEVVHATGAMWLTALLVPTAGAAYAVLALGSAGTLALIFTILLALLIGLVVLAIRQLAILICVLVAPLAIACYILPGTQKVWQFWKNTLMTSLAMFPIIMAFIAAGKAFAYVAGSTDSTEMHLLSVIVYFAPYFLLPFAFKLAGGLLATVFSIANDKSRGLFDRSKKYRQGMVAKNWEKTKAGNRFDGTSALSRRTSHALQTATLIPAGRFAVRPSKRRARMGAARARHEQDEASTFMKENAAFAAISADDDKLKAAFHGRNEGEVRDYLRNQIGGIYANDAVALERTTASIMDAKRGASEETFRRAAVRSMAPTGTAFKDSGEMYDYINQAYGDDRVGAGNALGEMRSASMQAGRIDLGAGGYGTMAQNLQGRYEFQRSGGTRGLTRQQATAATLDSAIDSAGAGQVIYGKEESAQQLAMAHGLRIQRSVAQASHVYNEFKAGRATQDQVYAAEREVKQHMASAAGIYDAMGSAAPQNARAFANTLTGMGFTTRDMSPELRTAMTKNPRLSPSGTPVHAAGPISMLEGMENLRVHDREFAEMRHDYGSQAAAEAAHASAVTATIAAPGGPTVPPGGMPGAGGTPGGP